MEMVVDLYYRLILKVKKATNTNLGKNIIAIVTLHFKAILTQYYKHLNKMVVSIYHIDFLKLR